MEFSEFARRLHAIIGAGSSTAAFTKSIIEIILSDEAPAITDEYSDDTYKAYFNGNTKITRLAKKVTAYIEPFNFSAYIDEFPDATHDLLVDSFSDALPDATSHDVGEQLAKLFEFILKEAAMSKRKTPKKAEPESSPSDDQQEIIDNISGALLTFAKAADATVHDMAEKSRQNKKKTGSPEDEPERITAEVEDGDQPSGAADTETEPIDAEVISDPDVRVQIINNPTIVNQNGEKNIHIEHLDVLNL
jgi:hypothetical protein